MCALFNILVLSVTFIIYHEPILKLNQRSDTIEFIKPLISLCMIVKNEEENVLFAVWKVSKIMLTKYLFRYRLTDQTPQLAQQP